MTAGLLTLAAGGEEWLAAREGLLEREKEHMRLGDELAPIRDRAPKGRDEGDSPELWIRRRDECLGVTR
jgi:predicted dithiol-disulfide oxidoreductase (DUF899 family)